MRPGLIAMLTDFGDSDWYVGTMSGVIHTITPGTRISAITHRIPPQDIRTAAMALESSYRYFPAGTIFLCVVDPGVGSERRSLIAADGKYLFIAPDNGLLTLIARNSGGDFRVWHADDSRYFLPDISATFQGRDIFAPLAAHLANGSLPESMGSPCSDMVKLKFQDAVWRSDEVLDGEVNYIDHFGNLMTNIRKNILHHRLENPGQWKLLIGDREITGLRHTYSDAEPGGLFFYWNSADYLEIAVNRGSAAVRLSAGPGTPVSLQLSGTP